MADPEAIAPLDRPGSYEHDGEAFLVPVKRFQAAKERLAPLLDAAERQALARRLAEGVIRSVAPVAVAVVCDDEEVASWARDLGADVVFAPGRGLNAAVAFGVERLEALGYPWITIAHGDLPHPADLSQLPRFEGITLVPDRIDDGTNVIRLPRGSGFTFAYGRGSFARHVAEAKRLGIDVNVVRETDLKFDIDGPEDYLAMVSRTRQWGPEGPH